MLDSQRLIHSLLPYYQFSLSSSGPFFFFLSNFFRSLLVFFLKLFSSQIFWLEMAPPNENDDALKLPVLDTSSSSRTRPFTFRSRNVSLPNTSSTSEGLDSSTVVLRYTDPHRTQRPPPSVQMNGPLFSTSSPEPLILLPPPSTGGSSDPVGVSSSQPERYPSFAALEHDNSDDNSVLNPHLLRSEKFGVCNDPYCTTCPSYYNRKADQVPTSRVPAIFYSMVCCTDLFTSQSQNCLRIK